MLHYFRHCELFPQQLLWVESLCGSRWFWLLSGKPCSIVASWVKAAEEVVYDTLGPSVLQLRAASCNCQAALLGMMNLESTPTCPPSACLATLVARRRLNSAWAERKSYWIQDSAKTNLSAWWGPNFLTFVRKQTLRLHSKATLLASVALLQTLWAFPPKVL